MTPEPLAVPTIAFDESGNTGPNLVDPSQPVFCVASVLLEDDQLESVLVPFESLDASELKFTKLVRSQVGRDSILALLKSDQITALTAKLVRIHKGYMVAGKIFDLLIEPDLHRRGINAYESKANVLAAEILYRGRRVCGEELWTEVEVLFVEFVRTRRGDVFENLRSAFSRARSACTDESLRRLIDLVTTDRDRAARDLGAPDGQGIGPLDPAATALFALLAYWSSEVGRFRVVHDHSAEIERCRPTFEPLCDPDAPKEVMLPQDDRAFSLPFNATEIALADSRSCGQLQVADILAGACALWSNPAKADERFAELLAASQLPLLVAHEVWPPGLVSFERLFSVWDT